MNSRTPANRIEIGGHGIGEISQDVIDQRALEIARSEGRSVANEKDREEARNEISGASIRTSSGDEVAIPSEPLGAGIPAVSSGSKTPSAMLEDENEMAERLVQEGIEEAERDTRTASRDEELS